MVRINDNVSRGSDSIQQTSIPESHIEQETEESKVLRTEIEPKIDSRATELASSVMSERLLSGYAQQFYVRDRFDKMLKPAEVSQSPAKTAETSPAQGAASIQKTLVPGENGPEVEAMQTDINKWRAQNGQQPIEVTGSFDKATEAAVREFQTAGGLKVDGKFGPQTRDHLALENDPNFQKLGGTVKESVRVQMLKFKDQPQARKDLVELATREAFAGCNSFRAQETALNRFSETRKLDDSYSLIANRYALETDPNFNALNPKMKDRIDAELSQSVLRIDKHTREGTQGMQTGLVRVATSPGFGRLSEAQQDKLLEGLRNTQNCGPNSSFNNPEHIRDILEGQNLRDLDDATRTKVIECTGDYATDGKALQDLKLLVLRTEFSQMTPAQQKAAIDAFKKRHAEVTIDHD